MSSTDLADMLIGEEIARILDLKTFPNGRYYTADGDKTACGLARTLRHVLNTDMLRSGTYSLIRDFDHDANGNPIAHMELWHEGELIVHTNKRRQQCGYSDARDSWLHTKALARGLSLICTRTSGDRSHIGGIHNYYVALSCASERSAYFDPDVDFYLSITDAQSVAGPGQQDGNVAALAERAYVRLQLAQLSDRRLVAALQPCGAWEDHELRDRETNEHRLIWLAGCDIAEAEAEITDY